MITNLKFTIRQITCLVAVAQERHFGRAAESLNISQPSLSRRVRDLEDAIGAQLLRRDKGKVGLTPAGEAFLYGSQDALNILRNASEQAVRVNAGQIGHLFIGYGDFTINGILPDLFQSFRVAHPDITTEHLQDGSPVLLNELRRKRLDFAFVTGPINDPEFDTLQVQSNALVVALYREHPLTRKGVIDIKDIAGEPIVLSTPHLWRMYLQHVYALFDKAGLSPKIVQTAHNSDGLFGLVAGRMGITLYPDCALNYRRKGVELRPLSGSTLIPSFLTWRSGELTPLQESFLAFTRAFVQSEVDDELDQ